MGNESSRDTKHTERGCQLLPSPRLALDQEVIRSSLRKRGLLVAESDLKDALDRHSNPVEAISFLIESDRARRAANVQRSSTVRCVKNDRPGPSTESALSTTAECSAGKRARPDSEVPEPAEANPKRRIHKEDPEVLVLSESAKESGCCEILTNETPPRLGIGCDSFTDCEVKVESLEMEQHVIIPMQPGLPSREHSDRFQGKKTESPRWTSTAADGPTERSLAKAPKFLDLGSLQNAMLSGVKGWFAKTPEEKNKAVRIVKDSLCLEDVGPKRKDQLDGQLTRCVGVALTDLTDAPDMNAGIALIADVIQVTRSNIHDVIIKTGDRYSELFSLGRSSDRASGDDVHRVATKALRSPVRLTERRIRKPRYTFGSPSMKSPSPADNRNFRPFNTPEIWRTFDQVDHLERGGLFSSSRVSNFLDQPRPMQPSQGCSRTIAPLFETPEGAASRGGGGGGGGGAACVSKAPEEEVYWIASDVCKETLRKARIARNEVKWLAHQADVVNEAADRTKAALRKEFQRQEDKVEKVGGDVQRLSGEIEELTRGLVDEHVASSQSKEESLLSFLDTLNGEDGVGDKKVRKRARAIALHEAARLSYRRESIGRLLASHAVKIGEVMCHELFGDLLDILSDMELRASQRRLICQSDLKSTAKHTLDKLKAAIGCLIHKRHVAAKKREERIHSAMENRMLFGNATANGAADQALINEMECFMEESLRRAKAVKVDAEEMWSSVQEDLQKEDLLSITEDAKQFFSSEADLDNTDVAESSPSKSVGVASQQESLTRKENDA